MIPLQNLQDLALDDSEHSFYTPRGGDWAFLVLVIITLLGTGLFAWHQLQEQGIDGRHAGRAIFFGFLLVSIYWSAILYAFKLSVSIRVGPSNMSVVRGPWRTELPWREVVRLVERTQVVDGQRLRWVVALARDGRRLQIREDMVDDYVRFRMEMYERYRLWRDHGGTWGTSGSGPFQAREVISTQVTWWGIVGGLFILPGIYFLVLLPETSLLGPVLLAVGLVCTLLSLRALAGRQTYRVDAKAIETSRFGRTIRLPWREVARVDRSRHAFNGAIKTGIVIGRSALKLAMRNDKRMHSFDWYPRVPEYLVLRGAGHQVRVNLHRVAQPDELLAWVEFYERVGRRASAVENLRKKSTSPIPRPIRDPEAALFDRSSVPGSPVDPWLDSDIPDNSIFEDETALEVPAAAFAAPAFMAYADTPVNGTAEEPVDDADDLEDMPTAEMQATPQLSQLIPPLGNKVYPETRPVQPDQDKAPAVPVTHSLDQLWAPAKPQDETPPAYQLILDSQRSAPPELGFNHDETEPEATPTETAEGLADFFAPWRADDNWQPPTLPRYGPPTIPASEREPEQHGSHEFSEDEFLR